jgi:cytochrome P450
MIDRTAYMAASANDVRRGPRISKPNWQLPQRTTATTGGPVDLHQQMMRYTMRVIGRLLFGADIDQAIGRVDAAFPVLNQRIRQRALSAIRLPGGWPTPANRRAAAWTNW